MKVYLCDICGREIQTAEELLQIEDLPVPFKDNHEKMRPYPFTIDVHKKCWLSLIANNTMLCKRGSKNDSRTARLVSD